MMQKVNIAIAGVRGRMGSAVLKALASHPDIVLVGELGRKSGEERTIARYAGVLSEADVIIDFTTSSAAAELAQYCAANCGPAIIIGATGFDEAELEVVREAAHKIPIVRSGNFSIGLNYLTGLIAKAACDLPAEIWDIEILESHHRHKSDAPSGSALMLGEAAALGRGVSLAEVEQRARDGITGERPIGEIGYSVIRGGGIIGEHSVLLAAPEEVIKLSHTALDRGMFARGALAAARWIVGRPPGEYGMQDVLGVL